MMSHSYLDVEMLTKNAMFRDESGKLIGAVLYDTEYSDRWYILHSISDEILLRQMIDYAADTDTGTITIKSSLNDTLLCRLLENMGFEKQYSESVLEIGLSQNLLYKLPEGFCLNDKDTGIVHNIVVTLANVYDVTVVPELLSGEEDAVYGDSGYLEAEKRKNAVTKNNKGKKIKRREHEKSSVRAKVEHVVAVVKEQLRYRKTRYRGLRKQTLKLNMMFALANLIPAARPYRSEA